jgi:hypothetical protein
MKAITIWEPWASLIMIGAKPYEFRGWPAPRALRGKRIVIHAGSRTVRLTEVKEMLYMLERGDDWGSQMAVGPAIELLQKVARAPKMLMLGCGLGTAVLGEPMKPGALAGNSADSDRSAHHLWAWPLTDVRRFAEPMPCRGAQGFFDWPYSVAEAA